MTEFPTTFFKIGDRAVTILGMEVTVKSIKWEQTPNGGKSRYEVYSPDMIDYPYRVGMLAGRQEALKFFLDEAGVAIAGCESKEMAIAICDGNAALIDALFREYDHFDNMYEKAQLCLKNMGETLSIPLMYP